MKKKRRNQFWARYMQMLKSYSNLKISEFWLFLVNGNFHDFFWLNIWNIL